jgi:hypothetical protein
MLTQALRPSWRQRQRSIAHGLEERPAMKRPQQPSLVRARAGSHVGPCVLEIELEPRVFIDCRTPVQKEHCLINSPQEQR